MTSLDDAKMPSLKDKIRSQEVAAKVKEVKVKKEDTKSKKVEKNKK